MRDLFHIRIHDVVFSPANARQRADGVEGFVELSINGGVRVPGFRLRRTRAGEFKVDFPTKQDLSGRFHRTMEPLSPEARRSIELQILAAVREQGWIP